MIPKDWKPNRVKGDFEWGVPSKSQKDVLHTVGYSQSKDKWSCDCPALPKKEGIRNECRHIRICKNTIVKKISWKEDTL